jgi:hypothetical protein
VETFEYRFTRIGEVILAANHDVHVVLNAEKRTTLGDPTLPGTRPIAQIGLLKDRNLSLQNVPAVFRRWTTALGENMTIP